MHRFHLPAARWETPTLAPDESHHCVNVLRLRNNERLTVFDGSGREATATIVTTDDRAVVLKLSPASQTPPPPCAITLAQAIPKGKNMELIVQKAVELGASAVTPILSDRTIVQLETGTLEKKRAKWQEVALEACKQCGQNHLPHIATPWSLKGFFGRAEQNEFLLIASLQPDARPLKSVIADFVATHSRLPRSATVLIGPEGDFTPAEIALAKSYVYLPINLGPIILRAETAAIYCLSVLAHELFSPTRY